MDELTSSSPVSSIFILATILTQVPNTLRPVTPNFPIILGAVIIVGVVVAAWLIVVRRSPKG